MTNTVASYGFKANKSGYDGLVFVKEAAGRWRFWDVTPGGDAAQIGPMYPTKDTLLADLHTFAASRSYVRRG